MPLILKPEAHVPTSVNYEKIPDGLTMQGELQQLGRKEEAVEPLFDNMTLKFFHKRVIYDR